jgi:hypothetical protein
MGDDPVFGWIGLLSLAIVPLYFAWWPRITLRADGQLRLRGWLRGYRTSATLVTDMYMTPYGLRFEFADAKPFTSVVLQATAYVRYPRYFDVVEAITGVRPSLEGHSPFNLGPRRTSAENSAPITLGRGAVAGLTEIVAENRRWVEKGEYRRALDRMRELVRDHSDDLDLRRATAQLYRELGNPDQAGRWGYIVPDGATDSEREKFVRSARQPVSPGIRQLLLVPDDFLLDPALEGEEPTPRKPPANWSAREHFAERFGAVAMVFGVVGLICSLLALISVFVMAGWGLYSRDIARISGGFNIILYGMALLFGGMSLALSSRRLLATAVIVVAVVVTFGGILLLSLGISPLK